MLIEDSGVRLLTDPGAYSTSQNDARDIDAVLITHEHQDHFHLESLKIILKNNPQAVVMTNSAVGALLTKENIPFLLVGDSQTSMVKGVSVVGLGKNHAPIYSGFPMVENTGYFIAEQLWYPGDALTVFPGKKVEILALPVAGPWMKMSEALDYALKIKPEKIFPVHDGFFENAGPFHRIPERIFGAAGIPFAAVGKGEVKF